MSALREVLAAFNITVDDKDLTSFEGKLGGVVEKIKKAGEIFASAFAIKEVAEFFKGQIEGAAHLEDTAEKLGLTTDALQHFQFAARSVGVEADSSAHSLGFLNKNIGEALTGSKESAGAFAKLGVHLKDTEGKARPVGDVLLDVSDGLKGLGSQQERAAYAVKLFGREGQTMLPILSQGSEKIREMYGEADELGIIMGGDFYKNSKAAREQIEHFGMVIDSFKARITAAALPAITHLFEWFIRITKPIKDAMDHTNAVAHALEFLAVVAGVKLIPMIVKLWKLFGGFKSLGIVAGLLALYVVFDDLKTMIEGGDSLLGRFLDKLYGVGTHEKVVQRLKDAWESLKVSLASAGTAFAKLLSDAGFDGLDAAMVAFGAVAVAATVYLVAMTAAAVVAAAPWIALAAAITITVAALAKVTEAYKLWKGIKDFAGTDLGKRVDAEGFDAVNADLDKQGDAARDARRAKHATVPWADHPAVTQSAGDLPAMYYRGGQAQSEGGDTTNHNTFQVTVQGDGKDPKATGQAIGEAAGQAFTNYNTLAAVQRK